MASVMRFDDWQTTLGTLVAETDGSGNVALGKSSPLYRLDVNGDINTSGDVRIGGTAVGTWTSWSPTLSGHLNPLGSYTVHSANYSIVNDLVFINFDVQITNTGSATGEYLLITFPTTNYSANNGMIGMAREIANTGHAYNIFPTGSTHMLIQTAQTNAGVVTLNWRFSGTAVYKGA